jgi:curved DNA-binding protein CbpA
VRISTLLFADPDGKNMNYYVILGIPMDADEASIRHAFRLLARRFHPDAGAGSSAEEFYRIIEAYETLRDPARRGVYDRSLRLRPRSGLRLNVEPSRPEPTRAEPFRPDFSFRHDIFEELFDELFNDLPDYPFLGRPLRC